MSERDDASAVDSVTELPGKKKDDKTATDDAVKDFATGEALRHVNYDAVRTLKFAWAA